MIRSAPLAYRILTVAGILACAGLALYAARETSLDDFASLPARAAAGRPQDIRIAVIGDSWVRGGKLDEPLRRCLKERGLSAEIVSSGLGGANSRRIYRHLVGAGAGSGRALLDGATYLIVVAGVNDTAGHFGADFYSHHVLAIINAARQRDVHPFVVEIPRYAIGDVRFPRAGSRLRSILFRYLFDAGQVDVIPEYREALRRRLQATRDPFNIVRLEPGVLDHAAAKHLYTDPAHLNESGNVILSCNIAREVSELHGKRAARK